MAEQSGVNIHSNAEVESNEFESVHGPESAQPAISASNSSNIETLARAYLYMEACYEPLKFHKCYLVLRREELEK